MDFYDEINHKIEEVNTYLEQCLPSFPKQGQQSVVDAAKYCLMAGGKRIRPVIAISVCEMLGGRLSDIMPFAVAIECIHTYSLIHDDLPCMDNDDLRRGKPTCHKAYGEAMALLAGDFLLNYAFELASNADVDGEKAVRAIRCISHCSGGSGMIGGQGIDITGCLDIEQLIHMYSLKTGALIEGAALLGGIIGNANVEEMEALKGFANNLGIAFQIKDDILDIAGDEKVLGKRVGSDEQIGKVTVATLIGQEKACQLLNKYTQNAKHSLEIFGDKAIFLTSLADLLLNRNK